MFRAFREKKYPFSDWLLIAAIIIISDNTLLFGTNSNTLLVTIKYLFIVSAAVIVFFKHVILDKTLLVKDVLVLFILFSLIILSSYWNDDVRMGVFYKFILFALALAITKKFTFNQFAEIFSEIMLFLCLYSLLFFFVSVADKSLLSFLPVMRNTNLYQNEFYNAGLAQIKVYDVGFRNYGLFREPGVFQMFICYAMLFQIYLQRNNIFWVYAVYVISLITTFSTTGYIALLILVMLVLNRLVYLKHVGVKYFVFLLLLIFVLPVILNSSVFLDKYDLVFGKFGDIERKTTIARFASITENYRMMKLSPLLGVGLTNIAELFPIYALESYGYASKDNTNMIMIQFASHGIMYGLLFVVLQYNFCRKYFPRIKDSLLVFLFFVVIYCGENLTFSVVPYVFLFYGLNMEHVLKANETRSCACM